MKIAMLGYGKMGRAIEEIALERNHLMPLKVNSKNASEISPQNIQDIDVAIEFSKPELAVQNISMCFEANVPVVVGTTGWYNDWKKIKELRNKTGGAILAATNFSVGVNVFFELNKKLARLMSTQTDYKAQITETHHTEKLDCPSGTAISLAEQIIEQHQNYNDWLNETTTTSGKLGVISLRENDVKGTHKIEYDSDIDTISIEHFAKNRKGFALGAVLAAEFIKNKTGIFTMKDVLNI